MAQPPSPVRVPKFEDNFRNYTFALNTEEFEFLNASGRLRPNSSVGQPFLQNLWWSAAEIQGLLDLGKPLKDQPFRRHSNVNPRQERASGGAAYYAALEQALVAVVSAWEVFVRESVGYVLNHSSFVERLAERGD